MPTAAGIYYAQYDGNPKDPIPVILIHGEGLNHQVWPAEIRRLNGQRVLALDLPGHGKSSGVGLQSVAAYADHTIEFMEALGLYHAVIVGHSMGGAIALEIAVRYSGYVAGLGLIGTGAYLGVDRELLEGFSNPYTLNGALHLFQQRAFGKPANPGRMEQQIETMRATRASVLGADWRACAAFDRRNDVSQISAPAWIITGSEDHMTPVAFANFLFGSLPAARLQVIPNAGHMVILEQPERVALGIQQFLLALFAARRSAPAPFSAPHSQPAPSSIQPSIKIKRKP